MSKEIFFAVLCGILVGVPIGYHASKKPREVITCTERPDSPGFFICVPVGDREQ